MPVDPKAIESIQKNQEMITKLEGLKKTVLTFSEKSKQVSTAFREHFKSKIDPSKISDPEKLESEVDSAINRLKSELKQQIQEELSEAKRRVRIEGPRGPKRVRKLI